MPILLKSRAPQANRDDNNVRGRDRDAIPLLVIRLHWVEEDHAFWLGPCFPAPVRANASADLTMDR